MDRMTTAQRRKVMQRNRGWDTSPEVLLRKALWHKGVRYRKNYRRLPGTPDIAITKYHIAIFVDGDFWHARGHEDAPGEQIRTNKQFWANKFKTNIARDRDVNNALAEAGWLVLRFWESDIRQNVEACVKEILADIPRKIPKKA